MRLIPVAVVALALGLTFQVSRSEGSTAARQVCALAVRACQPDLYGVSLAARGHRLLLDNRASRSWDILDVSPDRRRVVFFSYPTLFTASIANGGVQAIATVDVARDARWSPDGTQIVFTGPSTDDTCDTGVSLWLVDSAAGGLTSLSECAGFASWAPDSRHIAFLGHYDGHRLTGTISTIDLDTGDRRDLVEWTSTSPPAIAWSPRGDRLAYTYELGTTTTGIVATAGSRKPVVLKRALAPAWAPDGRRLAFVRRAGGESALRILDADTGKQRVIDRARSVSSLTWSRRGVLAYFKSPQAGLPGVFVVKPGTLPRRLTRDPSASVLAGLYWTRDGQRLVYGRCFT